ncbi:MAG: hypothetical protein RPT13_03905 [SAR324 cluster bacterium]
MANPILDAASAPLPNAGLDSAIREEEAANQLDAIREGIAASSARNQEVSEQLAKSANAINTQTQAATAAIESAASASQTIKSAERVADLEAQQSTLEIFDAAMGMQTQVALAEEFAADQKRVGDLLDEKIDITNDTFTGLGVIDNVINDFRSSQLDKNIEAAAAKRDQTLREIQGIGAATETFAHTNNLTKQSLTEGSIKAEHELIAANANQAVAVQELKNINANSDAMLRLANADQRTVSNLIQVWRVENEAQRGTEATEFAREGREFTREERILDRKDKVEARKLTVERQKLIREEMALKRERLQVEGPKRKLQMEALELQVEQSRARGPVALQKAELDLERAQKQFADQIATEDTLVESVQRGQALTGVNVEDKETILFGLGRSGDTGKKYIRLQELGGVADPKLGDTAFDAKESLTIVAPEGNVTETAGIKVLDQVTRLQAAKYEQVLAKGGKLPKDEDTIKADFNETADALMSISAANIAEGDSTNPYQTPPMGTIAQSALVNRSSFYIKVIQPQGLVETSPQRIVDLAVAGVLAKTVSPEEAAAGIDSIFSAAAAHNNTYQGGFRRVGLPNQVSYNTEIKLPVTLFDKLSAAKGAAFAATGAGNVFKLLSDPASILSDINTSLTPVAKTTVVDLMDNTRVKELLIKLLSSQPDTPAKEEE